MAGTALIYMEKIMMNDKGTKCYRTGDNLSREVFGKDVAVEFDLKG